MLYRGRLINAMPQTPRVIANPNHDLDANAAALRARTLVFVLDGPAIDRSARGF